VLSIGPSSDDDGELSEVNRSERDMASEPTGIGGGAVEWEGPDMDTAPVPVAAAVDGLSGEKVVVSEGGVAGGESGVADWCRYGASERLAVMAMGESGVVGVGGADRKELMDVLSRSVVRDGLDQRWC
jgi:hypothetical protein